MKLFILLFFQRFLPVVLAGFSLPQIASAYTPFDIRIHTGMGNHAGTLQWSIASDPQGQQGPNVLSELTFKDVEFSLFEASGIVNVHQGLLRDSTLFIQYQTGQATGGNVLDSDYDGNNRTGEYSRSRSSAEESTLNALNIGMGYRYPISRHNLLTPVVAFTRHQQKMVMTSGKQLVDTRNPANVGDFSGQLNSSYSATWTGVWVGAQWAFETPQHQLALTLKNYWMAYSAEADWNLRSDFAHPKSFEHTAVGTGFGIDLSYQYQFSRHFSLRMNWQQQDWSTSTGKDKVFFADGTTGSTQLNGVTWEAAGFSMGLLLRI
jgi:hypothetical protein